KQCPEGYTPRLTRAGDRGVQGLRVAGGQRQGNAAVADSHREVPGRVPGPATIGRLVDAVGGGAAGGPDGREEHLWIAGVEDQIGESLYRGEGGRGIDPGLTAVARLPDAGIAAEAVGSEARYGNVNGVGARRVHDNFGDRPPLEIVRAAVHTGAGQQGPGRPGVGGLEDAAAVVGIKG